MLVTLAYDRNQEVFVGRTKAVLDINWTRIVLALIMIYLSLKCMNSRYNFFTVFFNSTPILSTIFWT